jgi:hypothetical protein
MPLSISEIKSPQSTGLAADRLQQDLRNSATAISHQFVTVVFPSTANTDCVIATNLLPSNPEGIYYRVVDWQMMSAPATTPCVYRDTSTSRRAWGTGYIVLRCNVASVSAILELFIPRT